MIYYLTLLLPLWINNRSSCLPSPSLLFVLTNNKKKQGPFGQRLCLFLFVNPRSCKNYHKNGSQRRINIRSRAKALPRGRARAHQINGKGYRVRFKKYMKI
jgi:hypothetical protein